MAQNRFICCQHFTTMAEFLKIDSDDKVHYYNLNSIRHSILYKHDSNNLKNKLYVYFGEEERPSFFTGESEAYNTIINFLENK